ncbi:uncharacterized protein LOC133012000 [Limanda limanda]|uniref:uncharacterized protein LOC133012000 n=1 Tax=Limanda limanda TaxID=27771 RepID=UPI0029C692CE|nr:uncharacterized protein LOC133012000 [Limanda limanda]
MAHTVTTPCWDEDQPVCILLRHCQDMKRQETRLRLLTVLLLLGCSALYIFSLWAELRKPDHQSSGEQRAAEPLLERQHAAGKKRFNIHLSSQHTESSTDGYIRWEEILFSDQRYDPERQAIVIPEDGIYYIYIRTSLSCVNVSQTALFNMFYMELHRWNDDYPDSKVLTSSRDGLWCPHQEFGTVSVGGQFKLSEGDHVSVRIGAGYELIYKSTFGAFLVEG